MSTTKGPWKVHKQMVGPEVAGCMVIMPPDGPPVAYAADRDNARLIAAAPDLLAALTDVLACFDSGAFVRNTDSDGCSDWALKAAAPLAALGRARVAISQAEGA